MKNNRKWMLAVTLVSLAHAGSGYGAAQEAKAAAAETSASSKSTPSHPSKVEVIEMSVDSRSKQEQLQVQLSPSEQMLFTMAGVPIETSTNLKFKVSVPGKIILGADTAAWKIDSFTDDKGTDLFAAPGQAPKDSDLKKWLQIAEDGKSCNFEVQAVGSVPGADASRLSLSGTIALRCGSGRSTNSHKNVALKVGTKITASPIPLAISAVKMHKPQQGNMVSSENFGQVTLKSSQSMERLLNIEIVDPAGGSLGGSSNRGEANTWVLDVERIRPGLTIKVTSLAKVETVTIPLQVSTGLDIGG
jgi:hypothetical protein